MKKLKRLIPFILIIALAAALCLSFSGCGADKESDYAGDWDKVQQTGKLVIGYVEEPPFYYMQGGEITGFDYEYSQAVCEYLGVEPVYQTIAWESKDKLLSSGKVDAIWDGLSVTDERREVMDYSKSYLQTGQAVAIRKADKAKYTHISDVINAFSTFAMEADSSQYDFVMASGQTDKDSIRTYATIEDTLKAVSMNYADAASSDQIILRFYVGDGNEFPDLMLIPGLNIPVTEIAVGLRKGSDLTEHINEVTDILYADGTMAELAEKFNISESLIIQ